MFQTCGACALIYQTSLDNVTADDTCLQLLILVYFYLFTCFYLQSFIFFRFFFSFISFRAHKNQYADAFSGKPPVLDFKKKFTQTLKEETKRLIFYQQGIYYKFNSYLLFVLLNKKVRLKKF